MTSKRHITFAIVAVSALAVLAATLLWLDFDPQQVVPPCDDGDCEARNVSAFHFITGVPNLGAAQQANTDADSVEEVLEKGLALAEASPVHLAFRGSGAAGSVRCEWRGIARTPEQRDAEKIPPAAPVPALVGLT